MLYLWTGTCQSHHATKTSPRCFYLCRMAVGNPPQPTQFTCGSSSFHELQWIFPAILQERGVGVVNMKLNYKTWIGMLLLAGTLFAGAPAAFSQVSIGIQIGAPPPAQVVAVRPPSPYPEDNAYVWVEGYWYPSEGHYAGTPSDTTAPVTSLTSPTSGATISETASLAASASDNVGVTKVEFYANGSLKGTDTTSPYSYSLDTTTLTNASHSLTTKAYDAAGNVGTSAAVSMTVSNAAPTTNATYYVDQTAGNDANNGTSPTTAWKNAPGMAEYTGSGTLKPGDTVYFDRGDTWLVNGARGLWLIGGVTYIGDTWGTGTRATIRSAVSNDAGVVSFRDDATQLTIFQGFEVDANHTISSGIDLGHRYPILLTGATKRINNVVVHGVSSNASAGQYKYGIIMSSWPLSGTCSYTKGGSGAAGNVANVEVLNSKVYDISRTGIALYP